MRNGPEAVRLARRAIELSGGKEARFWAALDAACAEIGQFADAASAARKARELALAAGQGAAAESASRRLELYQRQVPYHQ